MRRKMNDKGWATVTTALLLPLLIACVALAIDMGIAYSARSAAQRAADSAALSGAFTFVIDPDPEENDIKDRAVAQAATNMILGETVTITPDDVVVDLVNRRVTVTVPRTETRGNPIPTYFSSLIRSSIDVRVAAVAEASTVATADGCTKP